MRGTRRTIVAAAASLAVVLGVGGVAAATSGHDSHADDSVSGTSTSAPSVKVVSAHAPRGKGPGSRHLGATSSTVAGNDDETSTTVEDETSTTLGSTTSTTVEPDDDHKVCDHDCDNDGKDDGDNSGRRVGPIDGRAVGANLDHDGPRQVGSTDGRRVGRGDRGHDGGADAGSSATSGPD